MKALKIGRIPKTTWFIEPRNPFTNNVLNELLISSGHGVDFEYKMTNEPGNEDGQEFRRVGVFHLPSWKFASKLISARGASRGRVDFHLYRSKDGGKLEKWIFYR